MPIRIFPSNEHMTTVEMRQCTVHCAGNFVSSVLESLVENNALALQSGLLLDTVKRSAVTQVQPNFQYCTLPY